jgi:hypothetical protein
VLEAMLVGSARLLQSPVPSSITLVEFARIMTARMGDCVSSHQGHRNTSASVHQDLRGKSVKS